MRNGNLLPFTLIVVMVTTVAWFAQQVDLIYGGPAVGGGALVAIPVLLAGVLPLAGRWIPEEKRAVVYAALAIGIPASSSGLMHRLLPALVTGYYGGFARSGSRYEPFLKSIPSWVVPGEPNGLAATGAFEGGVPVPWDDWAVPLAAWGLLFLGVFVLSAGLARILRDRWVEDEHLPFPLLELPQALLAREGEDRSLFRNRVFLWAVSVSVLVFGVNGLHHYRASLPLLPLSVDLGDYLLTFSWRAMAPFTSPFVFAWRPLDVGIAFLMPLEISFSTWFFALVSRLQLLGAYFIGLSEYGGTFPGSGGEWLDWPNTFPFFMSQFRGGLLLLAVACLWRLRGRVRLADLLPIVAGFGLMAFWMAILGLPVWASLVTVLLMVLFGVGFARLRLEGGLPVSGSPVLAGMLFYLVMGTGSDGFSVEAHIAFGFLGVLAYSVVGIWPALHLEAARLVHRSDAGRSGVTSGMALGLAASLVAGCFFALVVIYDRGLFFLSEQGSAQSVARTGRYVHYLYEQAAGRPGAPDGARLATHMMGAGVTGLLLILRRTYLRWPFHPVGYLFGTGFGRTFWGSALVGWAAKAFAVRYWSGPGVRWLKPAALGMVFGELVMRLAWAIVAVLDGVPGNGFGM